MRAPLKSRSSDLALLVVHSSCASSPKFTSSRSSFGSSVDLMTFMLGTLPNRLILSRIGYQHHLVTEHVVLMFSHGFLWPLKLRSIVGAERVACSDTIPRHVDTSYRSLLSRSNTTQNRPISVNATLDNLYSNKSHDCTAMYPQKYLKQILEYRHPGHVSYATALFTTCITAAQTPFTKLASRCLAN
ncbi:hypothetical protein K435DRAFT_876377 [Dendrothele bispora CBS 962.96]|uniref:Uncharacterized protein n=1 Tax=Dendrothele bispora (strain CBS 962.96) TaxID=1314807 RepID=A0A4S8KSK5_DENBC|nr:hypothetical protein K435DRAFT_876377 [Dendrothele bispora CBS 962.96]